TRHPSPSMPPRGRCFAWIGVRNPCRSISHIRGRPAYVQRNRLRKCGPAGRTAYLARSEWFQIGPRGDELPDRRVREATSHPLARLRPRAEGDAPIEGPGERRGIICNPEENSRGPRYGHQPRGEVELETRPGDRIHRIVLLGQDVEDDELPRLPLLGSGEDR